MRKLACLIALGASVAAMLALAPIASAWTVTMTAQPKLKRTYGWTIEKSVDKPTINLKTGETATATYSVTVKSTGSTDGDWSVAGTVDMSEDPNIGVADLTIYVLPEDLVATTTCTPSPFPVELGIQGLHCDYTSPVPDAAPGREVQLRAHSTAGNTRGARLPIDWSTATVTEVNRCVQVTDTLAGLLGTVCAGDAPKTFTYSRTIGPYAKTECGSKTIPNTASYLASDTGATGSASANVAVTVTCTPPPPPPCKDDHKGDHWKGGYGSKGGHHDDDCDDDDHNCKEDDDHRYGYGSKGGRGDDDCKDRDRDHDRGDHGKGDCKDGDRDRGNDRGRGWR